jgi:hypothetical protein
MIYDQRHIYNSNFSVFFFSEYIFFSNTFYMYVFLFFSHSIFESCTTNVLKYKTFFFYLSEVHVFDIVIIDSIFYVQYIIKTVTIMQYYFNVKVWLYFYSIVK